MYFMFLYSQKFLSYNSIRSNAVFQRVPVLHLTFVGGRPMAQVVICRSVSTEARFLSRDIYNNNNNKLQLDCHPVAVVILHVYKI